MAPHPRAKLHRVLGLSFGLAIIIGGTIGTGILRTPGDVAALLRNPGLIIGIWLLGGLYVLLGALSVAELGTMLPNAGGFYAYARRTFGDGVALMVGASDWLGLSTAVAYGGVALGEYFGLLFPALAGHENAVACAAIFAFAALHWTGVRAASGTQQWATLLKALAFAALVALCFAAPASAPRALPAASVGLAAAYFVALGSVIVTYDGWYAAIYFTEEDRNPAANLPRAMIAGTLAVIVVYVLVNSALLHALGPGALAGSKQPAADAIAQLVGSRAGRLVTLLSILSLVPLVNAILLCSSRILFAVSRDRLAPAWFSTVSARGTPRAMWLSVAAACLLAATGTFERLVAIAAFLFVVNHCSGFLAVLLLRRREPAAPRPFRVPLYPWVPLAALGGGVSYLAGSLLSDPLHSLIALGLVVFGYGMYRIVRW